MTNPECATIAPSAVVGDATLYQADCRDVLRGLDDNSIDSIVTDPPYALVSIVKRFGKPGSSPVKVNDINASNDIKAAYARASAGFMGKSWDTGEVAFSDEFWRECLRVLKPGGHVVAFSGTRTYHRMAVAIEDAGFEIRDQLGWLYGSGFPKSHNQHDEWEGWGTALKPAWEPIALARKPLDGTVAANLAKWGVGALNIDECRVGSEVRYAAFTSLAPAHGNKLGAHGTAEARRGTQGEPVRYEGRWPANIVHDGSDEVLAAFPHTTSGTFSGKRNQPKTKNAFGAFELRDEKGHVGDSGSAARFFYCAKASRKDRDEGLDAFPEVTISGGGGTNSEKSGAYGALKPNRANIHPTVKPTDLMRWLCRLVTPPGGVILDPFMGSGSTGKAALLEGFRFIGCEREGEYMPIAQARIAAALPPASANQPAVNDNQPSLFEVAA